MASSVQRIGRSPLGLTVLPVATLVLSLIVLGSMYVSPLLTVYAAYYIGALVTAVVVPIFLVPHLWRAASTVYAPRVSWAFRLNAIRGGLLAASSLAFVLLPLDFGSELMFKVLILIVPTLVIALPVMGAIGQWLVVAQPGAETYDEDRWVNISQLVTVVSWIGATLLLTLVVWVFEYWPVSLKHGPDTETARVEFEQHFGFAAPESVDQLYHRHFLFWQTNETYTKFRFEDRSVVDRILDKYDMQRRDEPQSYGIIRAHFPARWLDSRRDNSDLLDEYYRGPNGRSAWVDVENRTFYYMAFLD